MVMGVRMARLGCRELGIEDPPSYRDLVVYVEMDRCASDAVSVVCGSLWADAGSSGSTTARWPRPSSTWPQAGLCGSHPRLEVPHAGKDTDPIEFWKDWTDEQLFTCTPVTITVPEEDRPGRPIRRAACDVCGEQIQDAREVVRDGRTLCRACADGAYYQE